MWMRHPGYITCFPILRKNGRDQGCGTHDSLTLEQKVGSLVGYLISTSITIFAVYLVRKKELIKLL